MSTFNVNIKSFNQHTITCLPRGHWRQTNRYELPPHITKDLNIKKWISSLIVYIVLFLHIFWLVVLIVI